MIDLEFEIELDDEDEMILQAEVLANLAAYRKARRHLGETMRPNFGHDGGREIVLDPTPLPVGSPNTSVN
jgi:hypothetical protein